ncbi:hypothetical protein [Tunturiibacter gelidiferens]|uniref:hypothetical protein n=1 Tax=Tunturiibacter gelidiferens TaxID=3069689 RepID=UPI003D9BEB4F
MEFTIYRDSWRRGGKNELDHRQSGETMLLNVDNMMCVLGQCSFESGVPLENLLEVPEPAEIEHHAFSGIVGIFVSRNEAVVPSSWGNSAFTKTAILINDDDKISDSEREIQLTTLFQSQGHSLNFVAGIAPWFLHIDAA